jgi:hypothetical protein
LQLVDHLVWPSMKLLEIVMPVILALPITMCWRPIVQ